MKIEGRGNGTGWRFLFGGGPGQEGNHLSLWELLHFRTPGMDEGYTVTGEEGEAAQTN
jgi:hypothetical protein